MKNLSAALAIAFLASTIVACKKEIIGSGPIKTVNRDIDPFSAIDLQMNGNVFYKAGQVASVTVTAKESLHAILKTQVVNSVLIIRYTDGKTYDADESIRIEVVSPGINGLSLNTSGSIYAYGEIRTPHLSLKSSGSGSIVLEKITVYAVDAEVKMSGDISVTEGSTTDVKAQSMASGNIRFAKLEARNVTAEMKGSGDITVAVSNNLEATIRGSGSLFFYGSPSIKSHISGSGRLVHL